MKFTDGQWLLQPGAAAHYASEAYAVEAHDDKLVVLATTRPIKHRGDTLQGPTLTVTLSSPMEGVIRVSVEHFSASQPARLHVPMPGAGKPAVRIEETETHATLTSGALSVQLRTRRQVAVQLDEPGWSHSSPGSTTPLPQPVSHT